MDIRVFDVACMDNQNMSMHSMMHRREFLKKVAFCLTAASVPVLFHHPAMAADREGGKVLIIYFSHSGNTRRLAGLIHEHVGGDMVELKTVKPYPEDYDAVVDMARQEQRSNARPEITINLPDLAAYDTIFIGYPNWWGTLPMPFFTLLERCNLSGRTVIPFCTHEGSRFGRSEDDLAELCPRSRILDGFEVRGSRVSGAEGAVSEWLNGLDLKTAG